MREGRKVAIGAVLGACLTVSAVAALVTSCGKTTSGVSPTASRQHEEVGAPKTTGIIMWEDLEFVREDPVTHELQQLSYADAAATYGDGDIVTVVNVGASSRRVGAGDFSALKPGARPADGGGSSGCNGIWCATKQPDGSCTATWGCIKSVYREA